MKIAVIGGGSSYTPELLDGLIARTDSLPVSTLTLMDPDATRLSITAGLARRMVARRGIPLDVFETTDLHEAVDGARYVVAQMRVGGAAARIADEKLGLRNGLIGQETTGVGGFACALRTIPRMLDVAHAMEDLCPDAMLLNFTNPSGIITEALLKHSAVKTVGLCNIPIGIVMEVSLRMGCEPEDVELDYVGLNHLSWVRRFRVRGEDVTVEVLGRLIEDAGEEWKPDSVCDVMKTEMQSLGMYCNHYLQYFYATQEALEAQQSRRTTRGEDVVEIEKVLFEKYADTTRDEKPVELEQRGGAHYSTAALALLDAIQNDTGSTQIVCCRNNGAIPGLDDDVAIEAPALIGRNGAAAVAQGKPEKSISGLLQCIKGYESLTVKAAITGDRDAALQAMLLHPLMPGVQGAEALLDELLEINRAYLTGTFFNETAGVNHGC